MQGPIQALDENDAKEQAKRLFAKRAFRGDIFELPEHLEKFVPLKDILREE